MNLSQQAQLDRIEAMLKQVMMSQPIHPVSVQDEIARVKAQGRSIEQHLRAKAKAAKRISKRTGGGKQ